VHFPHTPYELNVYRIFGREPGGATMLVVGGIQGDEPGGFLAADRFVDLTLRKGNLILVPRANFYSILKRHRGPDGDMNRRFRDAAPQNYMDRIVEVIKGLMAEAQILLNLHDGSGFYSPRWESPLRNPNRYGQSIIADAARYTDPRTGRLIELEEMAQRVIGRVNARIRDERHAFLFNNHRTLERDTPHAEQRGSATFYALTQFGIPAFGVETSKEISDYRIRVQYQTMVINAFMEELDMVPDQPPLAFDPPQLQYLLISVNRAIPVAVPDRETLRVSPGDVVQVQGVVANYQRGITVDVLGLGAESDLQKPLKLHKDTRIVVRKDSEVFGQVQVQVRRGAPPAAAAPGGASAAPELDFFIVEVNGDKRLVENHGTLRAVQGDQVRIVDVLARGVAPEALKVNFIGYVRDDKEDPGEDRGVLIRTASDLWHRYALDEAGTRFRVVAIRGHELVGEMVLELQAPRLFYVLVGNGDAPYEAYAEGTRLWVGARPELHIPDLKTNVPGNDGVILDFRGNAATLERGEEGWSLRIRPGEGVDGEIVATRDGIPMGRVYVHGL
jgi:hypothetical protein